MTNTTLRLKWDYELLERMGQKEFVRGNWIRAFNNYKNALELLPPEASESTLASRILEGVRNSKKMVDYLHCGQLFDAIRFQHWEEAFIQMHELRKLLPNSLLINVLSPYGITPEIYNQLKRRAYYPLVQKQSMGYQNCLQETVLDPQFQQASQFSKGICALKNDRGWMIYNRQFQPIHSKPFSFVKLHPSGLHLVRDQECYNFLDNAGKLLFPKWTTQVKSLPDNLFTFAHFHDNKWGFINRSGKWMIQPKFEDVGNFVAGTARIQHEGLHGFINYQGRLKFPKTIFPCKSFSEGLAPILIDNRWGFINEMGTIAIAAIFEEVGIFQSGHCPVKSGGKWSLIDRKGKVTTCIVFDKITRVEDIFWVGKISDRHYFMNTKGVKLQQHRLFNLAKDVFDYQTLQL